MTNPWIVLVVTVGLIVLSTFFVIIEFALLGARRNRLEEAAVTSRAARAALRGINELTVMLAGAQLGITVCTFALGAITKPALDTWLSDLFASLGLVEWATDVLAFAIALLIVTFIHLVVGEMAPKSWAIAHPETSAILVGIPARGFVAVFRPLLVWMNRVANRLVKASGVEPVDRAAAAGYDEATIRMLVEHSAEVGALEPAFQAPIRGALDLQELTVEALLPEAGRRPVVVPAHATVADIREASARTEHMRILVDAPDTAVPEVVHVRDTLLEPNTTPARQLARDAFVLSPVTPVHEALARMQQASEQLAVVMDGGKFVGVITLNDALRNMLPTVSRSEADEVDTRDAG